ncbi:SMI1/KNR4 family protein [Kangiella aquimarina]|uniref:SMI1/KNR4 family protein n=2 Tax=Kangiella aquimarina TaxID=261965 RepID=A0ABZ0X1L7_9GAMM|nr:SMI1/KNR4 family protein [Kangiella aquimarina]WQG84486.1 SMI1/KNR4 family protein [Kangiella aquimarina]
MLLITVIVLLGCNESRERMDSYKYESTTEDWNDFLYCWQKQTFSKLSTQEELYTEYEKEVFSSQKQMFEPASEEDINQLEQTLGVSLPVSYTDFLSATDGWIQLQLDAEDGLLLDSTNVGYLRDKYPEWYDLWAKQQPGEFTKKYVNDYNEQDPATFPPEFLKDAIAISELVDSGLYLLVPNAKEVGDGWEAWFMSSELPGAARFPNFEYLMKFAYIRSMVDEELNFWIVLESLSELSLSCE